MPHAGGGTGSHAGLQETRLKEQGRTSLSTRDVRAQGSSSCPNNPRSSSPWPLPVQPRAAEQHRELSPESPAVLCAPQLWPPRCPRGCAGSDPSPDAPRRPGGTAPTATAGLWSAQTPAWAARAFTAGRTAETGSLLRSVFIGHGLYQSNKLSSCKIH